MSLPNLTGTGRLTADPEIRFSNSGMAVARIQLAFNQRRKNDAGTWEDGDSFYITGVMFKDAAQNAADSLTKGMEVVVTGRLKTEKWETSNGDKRSAPSLLIDSIGPSLSWATAKVSKTERNGNGGARQQQSRQAPANDDPWASQPAGSSWGGNDTQPPF